jgi:uncharacterized membrane protein
MMDRSYGAIVYFEERQTPMSTPSSGPLTPTSILAITVLLGAIAGGGVGAVIAQVTGAAVGAAIGGVASAVVLRLLGRQASSGATSSLIAIAALCCGLMAGFFFTFSVLIMDALAQQPIEAGVRVMQTINVVVFNPFFGLAFSGTPAACVLAMAVALQRRHERAARYALIGGALYLAGTLLVTVFCNVPRNDALAAVAASDPAAVPVWSAYLAEWTPWNHVRTIAAMGAAILFTLALASANAKPTAPTAHVS